MSPLEVARGIWSIVGTVVQWISPFALLWFGWWHTRKENERKAAADNAAKAEGEKYTKFFRAIDGMTEKLKQAESDIGTLREQLATYQATNSELERVITHTATLNRLNGRYTHELAQLVMVLGEGIRDQHLDGNITAAISRYRTFEANVLGSLITDDIDQMD